MRPRKVYRRRNLSKYSKALDRNLKSLLNQKLIKKIGKGMYYRPGKSKWGDIPPSSVEKVRGFLGTNDFLLTSTNHYNSLPLGLTQLSNVALVYNSKRKGRFRLGNLDYEFKIRKYPAKLTMEFLYIDLLNNIRMLPEDSDELRDALRRRLREQSLKKLLSCSKKYGLARGKKLLKELLDLPN